MGATYILILSISRVKETGHRRPGAVIYAKDEHKHPVIVCQVDLRGNLVASSGAGERQLGAGSGTLEQHLAAEAHALGRPAARLGRDLARLLAQALLVDEAAGILLCPPPPRPPL